MQQHTKDKLADALRAVGLDFMADRAAEGWYHDFLSPLDFPEITLVNDLAVAARKNSDRTEQIMILRERVMQGQFDANEKESEEWMKSPEGQAAMESLIRKKP